MRPPDSTSSHAMKIPAFSGEKTFEFLLRQTRFGPRNPGSSGHASCLEFLASEMRKYADEVKLQEFTHVGYQGEHFQLTNVIASFNPRSINRVLLCAHWDTRPRA